MDDISAKFIKTQDMYVAKYLMDLGYQFLTQDGNTWIFINNGKYTFEDERIAFSNILFG